MRKLFRQTIKKINCMRGKHNDLLIHDNNRHTIKQCRDCGKYEVYVKGLGILYRCSWEQLPYSYRY